MMINTVSARKRKRRRKAWILPGLLGVFLLHPLYTNLSHLEHGGGSPVEPFSQGPPKDLPSKTPPSPYAPQSPQKTAGHHREEKIFKVLSQFVTGLTDEEELNLASFIGQESRRYGFDPELIVAVISMESSFYNWSTSSKGALGLMQLIPSTGREVAEVNNITWHGDERVLFDPFLNIQLGIHYLYTLYLKFGNVELALTAYNHGPGNVIRWLRAGEKVPTKYADKVLRSYEALMKLHNKEIKNETVKNRNFLPVQQPALMASRS